MSTLIHFVPLLTTTAPCGQYFFFNRADFHHRASAPRVMRVVSAVPFAPPYPISLTPRFTEVHGPNLPPQPL
jgi:hypothetical protein